MTWHSVLAEDQLQINKPVGLELDGEPVVIVKTEAGIYALSDVCSHAEVALSEGTVSAGKIECWLHGAQFDLATGAPLCLPATKSVPVFPTRLNNAKVEVEIN
jgi:3-phenylpropionate/trans-cinnamate dioxygenase ferredoxin subunit